VVVEAQSELMLPDAVNVVALAGYVFGDGAGGPVGRLDDAMRRIIKETGIERATPHDLRRTHGTTITRLGFGRDAMNRIQNHKEGGIGSVYDRYQYEDENRRVMDAVAVHILSQARGNFTKKLSL
jgi:integrase